MHHYAPVSHLVQISDSDQEGVSLLPDISAKTLLTDEGYDADVRVLERLARIGKTAVIPPQRHRMNQQFYDKHLYQARHLIENFFGKVKQCRAIAARYDKTACNFYTATHLAPAAIWLT